MPFPSRFPARQFLEWTLVQVTIKSPIPVKPENVKGFAPILVPRRAISARPLVIKAAFALSPYPRPSEMPAPNAIIFFNAPPISTPITSELVYTRKLPFMNKSCTFSAY